jgi:WD40 repeat protein
MTTQAEDSKLLFVGFNQDYGCFACGTDRGFQIFNCDPFRETFSREFAKGGIGYVEMLFRCNILALVGGGSNPRYPKNKVMIWDDYQNRCIGELSFRSDVKAVKLRRDRVVVVLQFKIYVYNFADLKLVDQIDTNANPNGLCALCPDVNNNVLACPGVTPSTSGSSQSPERGVVQVKLYSQGNQSRNIYCHTHELSCFALSPDGSKLATASDEGTLIRIWDTKTGVKLQEMRRGADPTTIYSICFNKTSQWLAVSSARNTVHIFRMEQKDADQSNSSSRNTQVAANPRSTFSFLGAIVPGGYFGSQWSFSKFPLPQGTGRTIVAFGHVDNSVIVVSADGHFFKAIFDPTTSGGEAVQDSHTDFMHPSRHSETV